MVPRGSSWGPVRGEAPASRTTTNENFPSLVCRLAELEFFPHNFPHVFPLRERERDPHASRHNGSSINSSLPLKHLFP